MNCFPKTQRFALRYTTRIGSAILVAIATGFICLPQANAQADRLETSTSTDTPKQLTELEEKLQILEDDIATLNELKPKYRDAIYWTPSGSNQGRSGRRSRSSGRSGGSRARPGHSGGGNYPPMKAWQLIAEFELSKAEHEIRGCESANVFLNKTIELAETKDFRARANNLENWRAELETRTKDLRNQMGKRISVARAFSDKGIIAQKHKNMEINATLQHLYTLIRRIEDHNKYPSPTNRRNNLLRC